MNPALLNALGVVALVLGILVIALALLVAGYGIGRLLEQRDEVEPPTLPDEPPAAEDMEQAVERLIAVARNQDNILRDAWADEKRAEGWSDQDIEEFLEHRPEIELS